MVPLDPRRSRRAEAADKSVGDTCLRRGGWDRVRDEQENTRGEGVRGQKAKIQELKDR